MAAACALAMFSGKSIFICSSETPAGVSELLFHGEGTPFLRTLPKKAGNIFLFLREWGLFCIKSHLGGGSIC